VRGHPGQAVPGINCGRRARRAGQVQPPCLGPVSHVQKAQPAAAARAGVGVPGDRHMLRQCAGVRVGLRMRGRAWGAWPQRSCPTHISAWSCLAGTGDALPICSSICRSDMTLSKVAERGRAQMRRVFRKEQGRAAHSIGRSRDAHMLGSSEGATGHSCSRRLLSLGSSPTRACRSAVSASPASARPGSAAPHTLAPLAPSTQTTPPPCEHASAKQRPPAGP